MAFIQEEVSLTEEDGLFTMQVLQKDDETYWRDYSIIDLQIDVMKSFTPDEIIAIADKMKAEAKRIKKTYDKNGNKI